MNTKLPDILYAAGAQGPITPDSRLREDLDMDSLDMATLTLKLGDLGVFSTGEDEAKWKTVRDVSDYIKAGERV